MLNLTLLFSVLLSIFAFSRQCGTPTFENTLVVLEQNYKTHRLIIDFCVSPETIGQYDKTSSPIELTIADQTIPRIYGRAIADLNNLFVVTMTRNDIETIEKEAFVNLPEVQEISLHSNDIDLVKTGAFANLTNLQDIDLQNNKLEELPRNVFYNLPNLGFVNLKRNKFRSFGQHWFGNTPKLVSVDVSENLIDSIPTGSFINLTSIKILNFYHNQIEHVHLRAFDGLENLYFLNLGFNRITEFNFNFPALRGLRMLSLDRNRITFISVQALSSASRSLAMLNLRFNPLQCSCLERTNKWAVDNGIKLIWTCNAHNPVCVIPETQSNMCIERKDEDLHSNYFINMNVNDCDEICDKDLVTGEL